MKYVSITVISALVVALIAVSIMFISNRSQREAELDNAINSASREALEDVFLEYSTFAGKEEGDKALQETFYSKLNERIINGNEDDKDDNLRVEVEFQQVDSKEGLLSAKVTEYYTNIGGKVGTIEKESTVLIDEEVAKPQYTLSFIVDGRMFRRYQLNEGDRMIVPTLNCSYWKDEDGNKLDNDAIVTEDKTFEAVFV